MFRGQRLAISWRGPQVESIPTVPLEISLALSMPFFGFQRVTFTLHNVFPHSRGSHGVGLDFTHAPAICYCAGPASGSCNDSMYCRFLAPKAFRVRRDNPLGEKALPSLCIGEVYHTSGPSRGPCGVRVYSPFLYLLGNVPRAGRKWMWVGETRKTLSSIRRD